VAAISEQNMVLPVVIPRALRAELKDLTAKTGATAGEITRRALTAYLKAQAEAPAPKIAIDCTAEV
jgi:hypothetical protein